MKEGRRKLEDERRKEEDVADGVIKWIYTGTLWVTKYNYTGTIWVTK